MDHEGWWGVLLGGTLGALIGTVGSVAIALCVLQKQSRHQETLILDERRNASVIELLRVAHEISRGVTAIWGYFNEEDDYLDIAAARSDAAAMNFSSGVRLTRRICCGRRDQGSV